MIYYNLFYKGNPLRPEDEKKIYLVLRKRSKATIDEVCEMISKRLNLHKDLCRAVLNSWNTVEIELLTDGRTVELGDAGSVYLTASSEGAYTEKEAGARLVRNIRGNIRFSKKVKDAFNASTLMNAATVVGGINEKATEETDEN